MSPEGYAPLSTETVAARLAPLPAVAQRLGGGPAELDRRARSATAISTWSSSSRAPTGAAVVKQALPYVRLVGDSWPLPLKRSFFEYHALTRQERASAGLGAGDLSFRRRPGADRHGVSVAATSSCGAALIDGRQLPNIASDLGLFMARTLFRGSDLRMATPSERKADLALFADNVELCDITENLVFSDPYFDAKMNRHTSPQLDGLVAELRADRDLKVEAQRLKHLLRRQRRDAAAWRPAHRLDHGHRRRNPGDRPGIRLLRPDGLRRRHAARQFLDGLSSRSAAMSSKGERDAMRAYLLDVTAETSGQCFRDEFSHLWRTERTGMLYQKSLFEDQGDMLGAEQALDHVLHAIWTDMLGFAGVEIHRRILGLAHNADFETIADEDLRASMRGQGAEIRPPPRRQPAPDPRHRRGQRAGRADRDRRAVS